MQETELQVDNATPEAEILLYRDDNGKTIIADKDLVDGIRYCIEDIINRLEYCNVSCTEDYEDFINELKREIFTSEFTSINDMLVKCSRIKTVTLDKVSMIGDICLVETEAKDANDNEYMVWFWLEHCGRAQFRFCKPCSTFLPFLHDLTRFHLVDAEKWFYKNL